MQNINVEMLALQSTANKLESLAMDYQKLFMQLFDAVDIMKNGWVGKDNTAFTTQIRNFEHDFRHTQILIQQYADFLRNSAKAYDECQTELQMQVLRLRK